jgi:hypothetical protein
MYYNACNPELEMVFCECSNEKRGDVFKHVPKAHMYINRASHFVPSSIDGSCSGPKFITRLHIIIDIITTFHVFMGIITRLQHFLQVGATLHLLATLFASRCNIAPISTMDEDENHNLIYECTK